MGEYKSEFLINPQDEGAVKSLVDKYNKMFSRYQAKLQRLYIGGIDDGFFVVVPELYIVSCNYDNERYGSRSSMGLDRNGQFSLNISFPNWAKTDEELEDVEKGIRRVQAAEMLYLDFLDELMTYELL